MKLQWQALIAFPVFVNIITYIYHKNYCSNYPLINNLICLKLVKIITKFKY